MECFNEKVGNGGRSRTASEAHDDNEENATPMMTEKSKVGSEKSKNVSSHGSVLSMAV